MGANSSKNDESRRDTGLSDASRQANRLLQDRMRDINSTIQEFDTKVLKEGIIKWMQLQVNKPRTGSVAALKSKKFNEILLKLLQSLDSTIYGKIVSTLMWTLSNNHLEIRSERIHKDLLQYYLQQVYENKHKESTGSDINLFREFVDCWISTESIEILNHIIYFAMELEDSAYFDVKTVYSTKQWPKNDNSDLRQAFAETIKRDSTYKIRYLFNMKFKMESKDSVEKMKKLQFFLNQISEESRTISSFLYELFYYIFEHISLKVNKDQQKDLHEVITRFLFSNNSNLLAILLYLVRVIHSKEHNMFCEKQERLRLQDDKRVLKPSKFTKYLRRRLDPDAPYELNFTHDLSFTRRELKKKLVEEHLRRPVKTYEDLISRLQAFANHLVGFAQKDHFFIYFWIDILDRWIFEVFREDIDMDTKIEILHIITKYLKSPEVVVYLFAVEKLHEEKISKHQLYQLFKNTLIHEVNFHDEEPEAQQMNFHGAQLDQDPEMSELRLHRSMTRSTNFVLTGLPIIDEIKESLLDMSPTTPDGLDRAEVAKKTHHEPETQDDIRNVSKFEEAPAIEKSAEWMFSPSPASNC